MSWTNLNWSSKVSLRSVSCRNVFSYFRIKNVSFLMNFHAKFTFVKYFLLTFRSTGYCHLLYGLSLNYCYSFQLVFHAYLNLLHNQLFPAFTFVLDLRLRNLPLLQLVACGCLFYNWLLVVAFATIGCLCSFKTMFN